MPPCRCGNGLTNEYHPTQILADFLTLQEHFGRLAGLRFVYLGDARYNMGNSLLIGCAKMGLHFTACAPKAYWPDTALVERCRAFAAASGGSVTLTEDTAAVAGADVLYTDVWVSMGEPEAVWAERIAALAPYQVNAALMPPPGAGRVHALPARLPRPQNGRWQGDGRKVRPRRHGSDRRSVRGSAVARVCRSRQPHAHDQSRHGRNAGRRLSNVRRA